MASSIVLYCLVNLRRDVTSSFVLKANTQAEVDSLTSIIECLHLNQRLAEKVVKRNVLRDAVYNELVDLLISGAIKPGGSLSIDGLARRFEVSPTPVREALVELEQTGLVQRSALRGYKVSPPITEDQIRELIDTRKILESAAVERAFEQRDKVVPLLEASLAQHRLAAGRLIESVSDEEALTLYHQYFDADWGFHQAFLDHCGNHYLSAMTNRLSFNIHRMRQAVDSGTTDAFDAIDEHKEILERFRQGTQEDAVRAMVQHLEGVLTRSVTDVGSE